jgi:hypothetical protein
VVRTLFVGIVALTATVTSSADSHLVPLIDASDPLLITNAAIVYEEDVHPVAMVEFENQTGRPIDLCDMWVHVARFYTKAESLARQTAPGRITVWDCASIGHVDTPRHLLIQPHARGTARVVIHDCQANRTHEHFFVSVERLTSGDAAHPLWKREPGEFSRLLSAAQPHP